MKQHTCKNRFFQAAALLIGIVCFLCSCIRHSTDVVSVPGTTAGTVSQSESSADHTEPADTSADDPEAAVNAAEISSYPPDNRLHRVDETIDSIPAENAAGPEVYNTMPQFGPAEVGYSPSGRVVEETRQAVDIEEGPEGAEIPVAGMIPEASSFTVFHEDMSHEIVVPEPQKPAEKAVWESCRIEDGQVVLHCRMEGGFTPSNTRMGADTNLYLLELAPWEDTLEGHRFTQMLPKNAADLSFRLDLLRHTPEDRLYSKFVACIWDGEKYIAVSDPVFITNPEAAASNKDPYVEPISKKGLLIERSQVADAFDLGVCNVIVNMPIHHLKGEGIDYEYDGEIYHFSKDIIEDYDKTVSAFSNKSMNVTAVLLNGWDETSSELIYPGTAQKSTAKYYQFNAATREGVQSLRAVASFLAERYSGDDRTHGRIQNWIVGNEINNQEWNYIGPMGLNAYVREYCRSFRVIYTAIRSACAHARVFFSVDYNWNRGADGRIRYTARDMIRSVAAELKAGGDIDWNLAYHPYSDPMTEPEFWDDPADGQVSFYEDSPVVNFANLAVLTDFMQGKELLNREGHVRHIILSEEGFTSVSATRGNVEQLQAAAFAYAYYTADSNPYIDAFILSRQIDAPSELKQSQAFGLWTTLSTWDGSIFPDRKKYIWDVFKHIDQGETTLAYTAFAKEILGIERWQDIIPGFRWAKYEESDGEVQEP